jgi:hypothetical protein
MKIGPRIFRQVDWSSPNIEWNWLSFTSTTNPVTADENERFYSEQAISDYKNYQVEIEDWRDVSSRIKKNDILNALKWFAIIFQNKATKVKIHLPFYQLNHGAIVQDAFYLADNDTQALDRILLISIWERIVESLNQIGSLSIVLTIDQNDEPVNGRDVISWILPPGK